MMHFVTYGSFDAFIQGSAERFGCDPQLFREIYLRHAAKPDDDDGFKQVFGYMKELESLGYSPRK